MTSSNSAFLTPDEFVSVVRLTPLVSVDLIVTNPAGEVLVGLRTNRPAQNTWFVPGGRIRKGERIADAFSRLVREELGTDYPFSLARPLGVFEHLYEDNAAGIPHVGTHYVVLGYALSLDRPLGDLPHAQHRDYLWLTPNALLARADVHENTKAYFTSAP